MTEKLFYQDSHLAKFIATVESCEQEGKYYKVVLNRTAFFSEGGGQKSDTGFLDGVRVFDVQEKDGILYHMTEEPLEVGKDITGEIDWKERFSKMQQHSGEHIVSGLIHQKYGYNNVGFHLGKDVVTMDFDGILTKDQLKQIEFLANEGVAKNLDIQVDYPTEEQLHKISYRSKIEIKGQIRIVTIKGYDVCACCAPHVKKTGEIGLIKLTNIQNYKGGVRINMLCGFRALADYNEKEMSVKKVSVAMSAKETEIVEAVEQLKEEKVQLKAEIALLQDKLLKSKASQIAEKQERVCLFESELEGNAPRELVNLLLEKEIKICCIFFGNDKENYRYVIGSHYVDTRPIAKSLNEKFDGRGGGKSEMVQGSLTGTKEEIYEFFTYDLFEK
ncbi:alanyl-tRNA editing protein [Faecalimonas sp.]